MASSSKQNPTTPDRTSSEHALEVSIAETTEELADCEEEINHRVKHIRTQSFDRSCWQDYHDLGTRRLYCLQLHEKKSRESFILEDEDESNWEHQEEAQTNKQRLTAGRIIVQKLESAMSRCQEHGPEADQEELDLFMHMMTQIPAKRGGIGAKNAGSGTRDFDEQTQFKKSLIELYQPYHPEYNNLAWCPIYGGWTQTRHLTAAYIFPYSGGQDIMDKIFGRDEKGEAELFSPLNGLLISQEAEDLLQKGFVTLVPNVPDTATPMQMRTWDESDPKQYKIRIFNKNSSAVQAGIPLIGQRGFKTWVQRDGEVVDFQSDFRPRARYLHWLFASAQIRQAWLRGHKPDTTLVQTQFSKQFWGTQGKRGYPYIKRKYLLGLIQHLGGHVTPELYGRMKKDVELKEGEGEGEETSDLAVLTIALATRGPDPQSTTDTDDEDEDEDEDEI